MPDSIARRPPRLELADGRVAEWRLRELLAGKGLFSAVQLQQALGEQGVRIGASQAHELLTRAPRQPRMAVLFALCEVLDCTLADLWRVHQAATVPAEGKVAAGARGRLAQLKPVPARLEEGRRS
ncbi:MAG TPA: helix-turn-helix transcriptional regulator [Streptosporangiaceae bacterium]|jgi:DNA-binding Xre family transcriptional regulator